MNMRCTHAALLVAVCLSGCGPTGHNRAAQRQAERDRAADVFSGDLTRRCTAEQRAEAVAMLASCMIESDQYRCITLNGTGIISIACTDGFGSTGR